MRPGTDRTAKRRIFDIIQINNTSDTPSYTFDVVLAVMIILNILAMFLETFEGLRPLNGLFDAVEWITVLFFSAEYLLRLWTAEFLYPGTAPFRACLRFMVSFDGIVEILTILPFFFLSGAVAFRMMRVVRIFHLFRINSKVDSFNVITSVLKEKRNQILSSLFIIFVLMLASSLGMYSLEHEAQPDRFKNAFSGMWWSVSALLTVGYGDIYPVTALGRVMGVIISFLGVGAVAIPTGIISAGFVEHYTQVQKGGAAPGSEMRTLVLHEDSAWSGKTVLEVEHLAGITIALMERDGLAFRPEGETCMQTGDRVTYIAN